MNCVLFTSGGLAAIAPSRDNQKSKTPLPTWAANLLLKKLPEDKGLGDIIAREIGWTGNPTFEAWFNGVFGKRCRGNWTRQMVNAKWPIDN